VTIHPRAARLRLVRTLVVALAGGAAAVGCVPSGTHGTAFAATSNVPIGPYVGDRAPDFSAMTTDGRRVSLSDYRGEIVVLDFWATWCAPCVMSLRQLIEVHDRYAGRGVHVLAVNGREYDDVDIAAFARAKGWPFPVVVDGEPIFQAYDVSGIPHLVVIGPDGVIAHVHVGGAMMGFHETVAAVERSLRSR